jgi:hypothetical protein
LLGSGIRQENFGDDADGTREVWLLIEKPLQEKADLVESAAESIPVNGLPYILHLIYCKLS